MPLTILVPGTGRPYVEGDSLDWSQPLVFTVDGILAEAACDGLIQRIDSLGPSAAPITTDRGFVMRPDIRNNERVMFDDRAVAADLFARIQHALPTALCGMNPVGINERFRCYRYQGGQRFAPHYDGAFVRDDREESLLTFMIYLNEGFLGGATTFHDYGIDVAPKRGQALLFQHHLLHEGCTVDSGTKYVLRSDVMFRK